MTKSYTVPQRALGKGRLAELPASLAHAVPLEQERSAIASSAVGVPQRQIKAAQLVEKHSFASDSALQQAKWHQSKGQRTI